MLTSAQIISTLRPYGVPESSALSEKIRIYIDLLLKWNRKIALTSVTDPVDILKFHFGESLFAISTGVCGKSRLADVGTGAGFPGLALAIADLDLEVTLIESNLKKCAFLSEVIRQIGIPNARVLPKRMESVDAGASGFDWICSRALGQFDQLLSWATERLSPRGRVVLWLGEGDARMLSSNAGWIWDNPILIPGSERRLLLKGAPGDR